MVSLRAEVVLDEVSNGYLVANFGGGHLTLVESGAGCPRLVAHGEVTEAALGVLESAADPQSFEAICRGVDEVLRATLRPRQLFLGQIRC